MSQASSWLVILIAILSVVVVGWRRLKAFTAEAQSNAEVAQRRVVLLCATSALLCASAVNGFISGPQVNASCRDLVGARFTGQSASGEQALRLRTDLVIVDALPVQKKTGRILTNLGKDDFTLFEDEVKQTIAHFSRDQLPVSIILLIDRAGCVNPFNEQIRVATIKAMSQLKAEDEIAIMTFSNKVGLAQPFTRDRQLIADKIMAVERQHHSEQHYFNAAIYEAANYMSQAAHPAGRRAIIVLTSLEASIDFSRRSQKDALQAVLESGAVVSGILVQTLSGRIEQGIRGKPTSLLRHLGLRSGSLKMFVEETGGELVGAPPDKMEATLTRLATDLASSYSLAYTPTNQARDGKRRRIRVELSPEVEKREGKVALIARRSYILPKESSEGKGH